MGEAGVHREHIATMGKAKQALEGLWDRVGADLWDSTVLCRTQRVKQTEA